MSMDSSGLTRRNFLRFGLIASALSWASGRCKQAPKPPDDPTTPAPIYELTDGGVLYDDFDGNGNYQTYDGQSLAEAGRLSAKLWFANAGSMVVPDDAAGNLFVCVDESERRIEYAPLDESIRGLMADLAENPIPVTALDRLLFSRLLTAQGRDAIADIEAKFIPEQLKVIQYLLSKPYENFNDRGRKLVKIFTEAKTAASLREALTEAARQAGGETERYVASRLLTDPRFLARSQSSFSRKASPDAPQEIEYVFDAQGRLTAAAPRNPGLPYHAPRRLLVVGRQDALWETGHGPVAVEKGKIYGSAQVVAAVRNGYVLQLINRIKNAFTRCLLFNPGSLGFADFRTLSMDTMLSSASTSPCLSAGLDYHTTIPEQPPGRSWFSRVVIVRNAAGEVFAMGCYININLGIFQADILGPAQMDHWHNLRLDIVTGSRDGRLAPDEIRLDYYLDGVLKASRIPEDSPMLSDPDRIGLGPQRSFVVASDNCEGDSIAYFDNVKAVYRNRIG